MHQSVIDAFVAFSEPLEGKVRSLYADVKGLLTVGIGCLCDPVQSAIALPWVNPDGTPTSANDIATQWRAVKADAARLSKLHYSYAAKLTTMRLTDAGVIALAKQRLLANEIFLRKAFPKWDTWPADAQLFACSMAWAVGAGWPVIFGNCRRLLNNSPADFALCASGDSPPCAIKTDGNPGIVPRNAQNRLLLSSAQLVQDRGLPIEVLQWPSSPVFTDAAHNVGAEPPAANT